MPALAGKGCYSDDVDLPGQAYAVMVRSQHAHARIVRIARPMRSPCRACSAVLTGADYLETGLKPIPSRPFR